MVYEVYLRHGEVVLPGVVRAEIPGIAVEASGRAYSLERAIVAARNQWREEGRPLPRSSYTTDDLPMRERLDRLERAMALLGEECPPRHAGRATRSSPLYDEWADLKARFAAIIDPDKPFDSESPGDWNRVSERYRDRRAKHPRIPTTRRDNAELFGYERDGSWSEEAYFCDRFDLLASEWEQKQRALPVPRRCAACAEIRPGCRRRTVAPIELFLKKAGLTSSIATFPGDGEGQCFVSDLPAEQVVTNLAAVGIPAEVVEH